MRFIPEVYYFLKSFGDPCVPFFAYSCSCSGSSRCTLARKPGAGVPAARTIPANLARSLGGPHIRRTLRKLTPRSVLVSLFPPPPLPLHPPSLPPPLPRHQNHAIHAINPPRATARVHVFLSFGSPSAPPKPRPTCIELFLLSIQNSHFCLFLAPSPPLRRCLLFFPIFFFLGGENPD